MADRRYQDRFSKLEIPEDRRNLDWSFLEQELDLPGPLPLMDRELLVLINGRALVPVDAPPEGDGGRCFLYDRQHALAELDPPAAHEERYAEEHQRVLSRAARRFFDAVPPAILDEPALMSDVVDLVRADPPPAEELPGQDLAVAAGADGHLPPLDDESVLVAQLVGHSRLMRIHDKLYDLRTLQEYAGIFEKAIEPELFERLQRLPAAVAPEEALELINANLEAVHSRARSPLRNKMLESRLVFNGATLLPIYTEEAAGLQDGYGERLAQQIKLEILSRHAD